MRINYQHSHANGVSRSGDMVSARFFAHMTAGAAPWFMRDDDEDDYDAPDNDEILETMFPDEDDDFWTDNYDVN